MGGLIGANFGRDADTIATMSGVISGTYLWIDGIRKDWVEKARRFTNVDQDDLALDLASVTMKKLRTEQSSSDIIMQIAKSTILRAKAVTDVISDLIPRSMLKLATPPQDTEYPAWTIWFRRM